MQIRILIMGLLCAGLAVGLGACCCGDDFEKEWEKELEKMNKGGDEADDDSKEEGAETDKKDEKGESGGSGCGKLSDLDKGKVASAAEGAGWKVMNKTNQKSVGMDLTTVTVLKGTKGGTAFLYKDAMKAALDPMVDSYKKQDAAVEQKGNCLLAVVIPGHKDEAKGLLDAILK